MIIDTLKRADNTILNSVQATSNKHAAEQFKEQLIAMSLCVSQLEQLLNVADAMEEKNVTDHVFSKDIKEALQLAVDTCGEKISNHSLDVSTVAALKNAIELCSKSVEIVWQSSAEEYAGGIETSLSSLRSLLSDIDTADKLLQEIQKAKLSMPGSAKAIDAFKNNVNKGKAMVDELHLDSEAEKFIQKVRMKQATVADLTPHIMDWLNVNHLTGQIKVRF